MVDGAFLLQFVRDQLVALVEKQDAELLLVGKGLRGPAIVQHRRPRRQDWPLADLATGEALRGGLHDLQFLDGSFAQAFYFLEAGDRRRDSLVERAEALEQVLRQWLHIALWNRAKQNEFEKLNF